MAGGLVAVGDQVGSWVEPVANLTAFFLIADVELYLESASFCHVVTGYFSILQSETYDETIDRVAIPNV